MRFTTLTHACHEFRTKHGDKLRHTLLGDFNAKIGPMTSFSCGSVGAEVETGSGSMLRNFADEHSFKLLNTFRCDSPRITTWADNNGGHHRLDYVISDAVTSESLSKLWVVDEIDLSTAVREDHTPVAACLPLPWLLRGVLGRKVGLPGGPSETSPPTPIPDMLFSVLLKTPTGVLGVILLTSFCRAFRTLFKSMLKSFFPLGIVLLGSTGSPTGRGTSSSQSRS